MWTIFNIIVIGTLVYSSYLIGVYYTHKGLKPRGVMRIDRSDPDEPPYLFLELDSKIDDLKHGDSVCFTVSTENYLSPEKQTLL